MEKRHHPIRFAEPESIAEAKRRKRELLLDILSIEQQLTSNTEDGKNKQEYQQWRAKAHKSLVFKKAEHLVLKDWITERRRLVEAKELGIWNPNDPREILLRTRAALLRALDGDDLELGAVYNVIDQFLQHEA